MMTTPLKRMIAATVLLGTTTASWALDRSQADLSGFESLTEAATLLDDNTGWLSWQVPAWEGQRSSCCWQGKWQDQNGTASDWSEQQVCDLGQSIQGTGMSDQSPITASHTVLARLKSGKVEEMIAVGESCPIRGDGITLIDGGALSASQSNRWMTQLINQAGARSHAPDRAMSVIGMTADPGSIPLLKGFASQTHKQAGRQAIFWIGQSRQPQALDALNELIETLPSEERRQSINFALTQHHSKAAIERLYELARSDRDPEQRGDALFWLAQSQEDRVEDPGLVAELSRAVLDDAHPVVTERALHALSTLNSEASAYALAELANSHPHSQVRSKSLFWLAQSSSERAKPLILSQLKSLPERGDANQTVFALSQLPGEEATASLLMVATGDYPVKVRKQALFWLAQSDDPAAMDHLEKMLTSHD